MGVSEQPTREAGIASGIIRSNHRREQVWVLLRAALFARANAAPRRVECFVHVKADHQRNTGLTTN